MKRAPLLALVLGLLGCAHTVATDAATAARELILDDGDSMMGTPACAQGAFLPGAQEVPTYLTCAVDADCVHAAAPSCCKTIHFALHKDHVCVVDLGSSCDMVCEEEKDAVFPRGGASMHAVCADGRCALRP